MKETIKNTIENWVKKYIGSDFVFRKYQLETICNIVTSIVDNDETKKNRIIEAPTGSGKSLIAIISAGVLATEYNKQSYILCSDLYLWDQYDVFIKNHPMLIKIFGSLKGQSGNYICMQNHEDLRNAECRVEGVSWKSLMSGNSDYECASTCKYVQARKRTRDAKVCLMTYQCYLYQVNRNPDTHGNKEFKCRDVVFCDECHNIPNICSGKFSPTIRQRDLQHFIALYNDMYVGKDLFSEPNESLYKKYENVDDLTEKFKYIYRGLCNENNTCYEDAKYLKLYGEICSDLLEHVKIIEEDCKANKKKGSMSSKHDIERYKECTWLHNTCCYLSDFAEAIKGTGEEYIIKNITQDKEGNKIISVCCSKEDYVVNKFLLSLCNYRVMLSATVGLRESFEDNIGIKYSDVKSTVMDRIPSTFDFSKSPIVYFTKYKMSNDYKEVSLKALKPILYGIMQRHANQKGLIQTGSYAIAKDIYNSCPANLKHRLLMYDSAAEKTVLLKHHQTKNDTILIGPTLTEGIDLPDDGCRFIIILKMPFPLLTDKLVKAKMKLFPKWYMSETANSVIQGIGRGNRNENDWCITYILDACFNYLFHETQSQFTPELKARLVKAT